MGKLILEVTRHEEKTKDEQKNVVLTEEAKKRLIYCGERLRERYDGQRGVRTPC